MEIAIVTAYFLPVNNPRAFRATELAEEFSRRGHNVTVYNAFYVANFDYESFGDTIKYRLINLNLLKFNSSDAPKDKKQTKENYFIAGIKNYIKDKLFYFTTNTWLVLYLKLRRSLKIYEPFDLLISIGLPFHVHWAVGNIINKNKELFKCTVADCGDPFSYNTVAPIAPYFKLIEKRTLNRFDFISVPIPEAVSAFTAFKDESKIKIIPQGLNFEKIHIAEYTKNKIITFGFAGLFYSKIRNPKMFFEYLCGLDINFRFLIYTNIQAPDSYSCILPYIEKLNVKLVVNNLVSRENVIYELSRMDFLINFSNISTNQSPSKLIDYTLAKRPIFSMNQNYFDREKFDLFLKGDYTGALNFSLSSFDIRNIAYSFTDLLVLKNKDSQND